jgi:hypothetical protein
MPAMASATVSRQLLDRTHVRDTALVVAIASIVAATGGFSASQLLPVAEYWWMDLPAGVGWPGWTPFFGPWWLTAWIAGGLLPGVLTALALSGRADRWWLRLLAGLYGAWCAAVIAALIWWRPDATLSASGEVVELDDRAPLHLIAFGAGLLAALHVALRRRRPAPTSRALALPLTVAACLAIGAPTLVETFAEYRPQELRAFRLELVAAYPLRQVEGEMPAVVIDRDGSPGEIIESDGHRFNIHRTDRLVITSDQVERVRWIDGADAATISVRLDRDTAAALGHRSNRRISQYDALFLDGRLVGVPIYNDLVTRLWYASPDRAAQRAFYQALTGAPP